MLNHFDNLSFQGVLIMDVKAKVLEVMRAEGQPLNAGKIAELGGFDRKAVDKAMTQLKKEEKIVSPKRCYWTPV
jgi:hypothetical protein